MSSAPDRDPFWENIRIAPESLPPLEEASFERLEKDYLWLRLTTAGIIFFVLAGIGIVMTLMNDLPLWYWLAPWLVLVVLRFTLEIAGFRIKGYSIRQHDISYKSGLLFFTMTSIPFNRVQHCEMSQSALARLFDLAAVKIYTAGGSSSDITIHGLTKERAERLRDYVTQLSSTYE